MTNPKPLMAKSSGTDHTTAAVASALRTLDAEASGILNDLYEGSEVEAARLARLLCLFRLDFIEAADMRAEVSGHPVYLAMAMDQTGRLTIKPQNLLLNLPLASRT